MANSKRTYCRINHVFTFRDPIPISIKVEGTVSKMTSVNSNPVQKFGKRYNWDTPDKLQM